MIFNILITFHFDFDYPNKASVMQIRKLHEKMFIQETTNKPHKIILIYLICYLNIVNQKGQEHLQFNVNGARG